MYRQYSKNCQLNKPPEQIRQQTNTDADNSLVMIRGKWWGQGGAKGKRGQMHGKDGKKGKGLVKGHRWRARKQGQSGTMVRGSTTKWGQAGCRVGRGGNRDNCNTINNKTVIKDLTLGEGHTMQYMDYVSKNCMLKTYIILLTNITPIHLNKINK